MVDVVVVGAGLAGLTAARELAGAGLAVQVVEPRRRVGGRVMTVETEAPATGWFDLGATWHWSDQPAVRTLADELGVDVFPHHDEGGALHEPADGSPPASIRMPPAAAAQLRFAGGAQPLCQALADELPTGSVIVGTKVTGLTDGGDHVEVATAGEDGGEATFLASRVVVAMPPRLVVEEIAFAPVLPPGVVTVLETTPTWMGDAIKCVAVYDSAFWRGEGLSGAAFSELGPLSEVHDASVPGGPGALWGFLDFDHDLRELDPDERAPLVFAQLGRLFGPEAADPVEYFERDWSSDAFTCESTHRHVAPLDYGHPAFAEPLWAGRLHWAGAETVAAGGGHMEGAVRSGQRAARAIAGPGPLTSG